MVSFHLRHIILIWALTFAVWCQAENFLPAREWRDVNGQIINAQIVDWDTTSITVVRPGVYAMNGKQQEFRVPLARLSPDDQAYAEKLIALKTEFELLFNQQKLQYPTREVMGDICERLRLKGILQSIYIPDDQLMRRYQNLNKDLKFDNFEYQMAYLRKSLDSDTNDYDQDTKGRGLGPIAEQYQENLKWIRVYLIPYLNTLTDKRQSYLEQILAIPIPSSAPDKI